MHKKNVIIISFMCLLLSIFLFAIKKNWIIFYINTKATESKKPEVAKKTIKNFFWRNEKWHHEDSDIIWDNNNPTRNLEHIIQNWLGILEEENIMQKKITVQYVLLHEKTSYISLDGSMFGAELAIYEKLKIIEGLFKTIESYFPNLKIYFLVHNEPLDDYHIDFSNPLQQALFE